eukprot:TRINITY_DN22320_c0_g2_i1.p1 TRINITY_DN22320_c0_g2~~TRINITY_DN22320_c0_g2_i1.p1  ORF type:complete len:246 (+),score=10.62 TRINITY_DN22320_c0_g2_i1:87-824(+)
MEVYRIYAPQFIFERCYKHLQTTLDDFTFIVMGSLTILVVAFLLPALPYFLFQFIPSLSQYRLQKRTNTAREQLWCAAAVFCSHFMIYVPAALAGYHFVIKGLDLPRDYDSMPPWWKMCAKVIIAMVFEDTWHYFNHFVLHYGWLYPKIHKIHHRYQSPFAIAAEYAHPFETMWLGLGFFIPSVLLTDHIAFFWFWLIARLVQTTDVHSGYSVPLNIFYLIPGYGGAKWHDFHHQNFTGNYGSSV